MRLRRSLRRTSTTAGCAIGPPSSTPRSREGLSTGSDEPVDNRRGCRSAVASSGHDLVHHPIRLALPPGAARPRTAACSPLGAGAAGRRARPDTAFVVDGLPPPLAALLDRLDRPTVTADARRRRRGARRAARRHRDAARRSWSRRERWSTRPRRNGRPGRGRRGVVSVRGRGPLAVGIVTGLLHSGIGTVHTDTGGAVRGGDLGTGYADADRGGERLAATQAAVRRLLPGGRHAARRRCGRARSRRARRRDSRARARRRAARQRRRPSRRAPARRRRRRRAAGATRDARPAWAASTSPAATSTRAGPPWPPSSPGARASPIRPPPPPRSGSPWHRPSPRSRPAAGHRARAPRSSSTSHAGALRRRVWSAHPDCPCGAGHPVDRASRREGDTIMR